MIKPLHAVTTRRTFLQLASMAGVATSVGGVAVDAQVSTNNEELPGHGDSSLLALVNPMQGTNSSVPFSRGNTLPIVARPFGMAHWTLQSHDQPGWFFDPGINRIQGLRLTHQLSPWLGDYGYAAFLPFTGEPSPDPDSRASSYRPRELEISPSHLSLFLMRYRCTLELTPTERCCVIQTTFDESMEAGLYIDLPGDTATASCDAGSGVITALVHENSGGVPANFATYLYVKLDRAVTSFTVKELKGRRVAVIRFHAYANAPVEARVGTSFISMEQAHRNLEKEAGSKPFQTLVDEASSVWEHALARVRISGRTETDRRTFYSCLYRTLLFPRIWYEFDHDGKMVHMSPYTGRVEPGLMYADHGFWDDYHAWYPMMLLLYPERLRDILQSWVNASKEGGWIPQFPCPGYRGAMTGSPSDIIFGDAAAKGLGGFDLETAYAALKKQATEVVHGFGFGRVWLEPYLQLGYVPCDNNAAGVAETLDYVYGDFCIAQIARALGKQQDAEFFLKRSQNWTKLFDSNAKFFRGKLANGSWIEPFDAFIWGGAYVEGGPWQYRFNVPFDPQGLMNAFGGRDNFLHELESMFTTPPKFNVGTYGAEIHEMSEMAAADFGQYAHSNQPVHNVLYLFTVAGRRDRTQHYAHRVLKDLYNPDNFCGDEDTGSMSAWYILSSLGLFAACPGDSRWTLGAPYFSAATITHADGTTLNIEAQSTDDAMFLSHVTLNGTPTDGMHVEHRQLANARLVFTV
jgi:predicted alpha-1,2-mannosidase